MFNEPMLYIMIDINHIVRRGINQKLNAQRLLDILTKGKRTGNRRVEHYPLDVIISIPADWDKHDGYLRL
jgi:hypothetical protein